MNQKDDRDPETYAIIGAGMAVHGELGHGFLELPYQEAMAVELKLRSIPYAREVPLAIDYKGNPLPCDYKADLICFGSVLVEFKAVEKLIDKHKSQLINYLNATGLQRGLLLNFGAESFQFERIVWNFKR
jgi:GxxExxY protein